MEPLTNHFKGSLSVRNPLRGRVFITRIDTFGWDALLLMIAFNFEFKTGGNAEQYESGDINEST